MNLEIFLWSAVNRSAPAATLSNFVTGHLLGRTLTNIRYLQGCKKRLGVSNPLVLINMTLSKTNIGDLPKFIKLAHDLDAQVELNNLAVDKSYESIQVKRGNQFLFDYKTEILTAYPKLYNQYLRKAEQLGRRLNVTIHKASDVTYMDIPQPGFRFLSLFRKFLKKHFTLHQLDILGKESSRSSREKDPSFENLPLCLLPWTRMVIGAKGDISLCCVQGPIDYLRNYASLEEAWNPENIYKIREKLINKTFPPECQTADCTVKRWNTRVCVIHQ